MVVVLAAVAVARHLHRALGRAREGEVRLGGAHEAARGQPDAAEGFWSRLSPQKSPRIAPQSGSEILLQASPRIAPEGLPVQSQASRVSPRVAPDV